VACATSCSMARASTRCVEPRSRSKAGAAIHMHGQAFARPSVSGCWV
jgi:hypothetical protein